MRIPDKLEKNGFLSLRYSSSTKIRPQAKIYNFAFKNSNIIIEKLIKRSVSCIDPQYY